MSQYYSYKRPSRTSSTKHRKHNPFRRFVFLICGIIVIVTACLLLTKSEEDKPVQESIPAMALTKTYEQPVIKADLLDPNPYSRPQQKLTEVNGIVVHYVGNPGTSAEANRNYFNGLAKSKATYASSHFIIDLDGTIVQCIPLTEISYASNSRNKDTISIEVCHPDETGKFTTESYKALVTLTRWLSSKYELNSDAIIRHYDITGKLCPLYYVEHEDAWAAFKKEVFRK